jgi:hypothetical protein
VWCRFPDGVKGQPKPRPALVLDVFGESEPYGVRVIYGTSKKVRELFAGEFAILRLNHPQAYALANLSYDTKFDFRKQVELPYTSEWFEVPPAAPHGQVPKLGTLHPSMIRAARAALQAACP